MVYRPLRTKWAISPSITIQNMRFMRKLIIWWTVPLTLFMLNFSSMLRLLPSYFELVANQLAYHLTRPRGIFLLSNCHCWGGHHCLKFLRNRLVGHFSFNFDISSARSWRLLWAQRHLPFGRRRGARLSMRNAKSKIILILTTGGQAWPSVCWWLRIYKAGWTHRWWILLQVSLDGW